MHDGRRTTWQSIHEWTRHRNAPNGSNVSLGEEFGRPAATGGAIPSARARLLGRAVLRGRGDGIVDVQMDLDLGVISLARILSGDIDGDGRPDLVGETDSGVMAIRNTGPSNTWPFAITPVDVTGAPLPV
jgi:hypothetical protein